MNTIFHCTPISYENLGVVNWVNEDMESLILGPINDGVGASIVYKHYQLMVFNVVMILRYYRVETPNKVWREIMAFLVEETGSRVSSTR